MLSCFGFVDRLHGIIVNFKVLRIHFVFGQVLHVYTAEGAQTDVESEFGKFNTLDFQSLK